MRVLITGGGGQVGKALSHALSPQHELIAPTSSSLDITRRSAPDVVAAARPDIVIHAAAWTDVDGCARDPDLALTVNGLGTWHMALACRRLDIPLVYISTNEVFDGTATEPYLEWDEPHPINPYARSKYVGEQYVRALLQRFYLVRVAWVFGGERNFVRTILRLASERERLTVVDDEIGNPTYAEDIAAAVRSLIAEPA